MRGPRIGIRPFPAVGIDWPRCIPRNLEMQKRLCARSVSGKADLRPRRDYDASLHIDSAEMRVGGYQSSSLTLDRDEMVDTNVLGELGVRSSLATPE